MDQFAIGAIGLSLILSQLLKKEENFEPVYIPETPNLTQSSVDEMLKKAIQENDIQNIEK